MLANRQTQKTICAPPLFFLKKKNRKLKIFERRVYDSCALYQKTLDCKSFKRQTNHSILKTDLLQNKGNIDLQQPSSFFFLTLQYHVLIKRITGFLEGIISITVLVMQDYSHHLISFKKTERQMNHIKTSKEPFYCTHHPFKHPRSNTGEGVVMSSI